MHAPMLPGRPIEILLVEDNPDDVRLTIEALREGKVANHLRVAHDGRDALRELREAARRPDLVLLDLNLPRMSGQELLAVLRQEPVLRNIPVAIVTASSSDYDKELAERFEVTCYLNKPIDVEQLIKVVMLVQGFGITVVSLARRTSPDDTVAA